jgi:hypothetical protein
VYEVGLVGPDLAKRKEGCSTSMMLSRPPLLHTTICSHTHMTGTDQCEQASRLFTRYIL